MQESKRFTIVILAVGILLSNLSISIVSAAESAPDDFPFVPPSVPLVACDPYFSIWSPGKTLTETGTTHWTGKPHRLTSLIRIDGKTFRLMGNQPASMPALKQVAVEVMPTRTVYQFEGAGTSIELVFMTPALPEDIDILSRPVTYITYKVHSLSDAEHTVSVLTTASAEIAVNTPKQHVRAEAESFGGVKALKIGSVEQNILGHRGDDIRIDWGYFYLAAEDSNTTAYYLGNRPEIVRAFTNGHDVKNAPGALVDLPANRVTAAVSLDLGAVAEETAAGTVVVAYDDLYSIEFMKSQLRPYWRRNGLDAGGLLQETFRDFASLQNRCEAFDQELYGDLETVGGVEYARLASLAYRQCFAAGKFVADANGQPIQFCKENHSNGCIGTSDVFYPMSPQFLLFGPSLAKSFVVPFMEYAASERWTFPFAPHDLGTYPKANGQVYGGGEESEKNQMPVEESGNMLVLMAAIAKIEGNADFSAKYWPQLLQWAEYLRKEGFDPDNQLCTDDFAGHLAHNVNLSAKAICGLGAFAQLCELRGETQLAQEYRAAAEDFAARWVTEADDGNHFRLAFDKPNTWSQKYNLVWDRLLGLNLFPDSVLRKEMDYYQRMQNGYGLPLDNRKAYTKLDWILWTATLTREREDFLALVRPVYRFLRETPDRVPMTDWYETDTGKRVGFTARPVVGGVFMQMLHDEGLWKKWAAIDRTRADGYADMPIPPEVKVRLAAADSQASTWKYTTQRPAEDWSVATFDDSAWSEGPSGFGKSNSPSAHVGTLWDTSDIWLRRHFDLPQGSSDHLKLHVHYDEDAEIYINGVLALQVRGYSTSYEQLPIREEALETLKKSGNLLAVHCHQSTGGQFIDVGLATLEPAEKPASN